MLPLSFNYLVLALNKRGYFNCNDRYLLYGVATATIIELVDLEVIEVWDKHIKVTAPLPRNTPWLAPVYETFSAAGDNAAIGDMVNRLFIPVFTNSRARATLEAYWKPLEDGCYLKRKPLLLGRYVHEISNISYYRGLEKTIEAQVKGCDAYDEYTLTLAFILKHSRLLKRIGSLSSREIREFTKRVDDEALLDPGKYSTLNRNRDIISCVSFATSAMGGNFF